MLFSKSFGYALRGVLYIAASQKEGRPVQVDDIAAELNVRKYFLAKILKGLVKEGFLASMKGPRGGFSVLPEVHARPLIELLAVTDGLEGLHICVLHQERCRPESPCPLHHHLRGLQDCVRDVLAGNTIGSFLNGDAEDLLRSLGAGRTNITANANSK